MRQTINSWLKNKHLSKIKVLSATILNTNCFLCAANQTTNHGLCEACLKDLPWLPASNCPQCGLSSSGHVCGSCLSSPPYFDATHAVFLYSYPVDAMVQRYKYGETLSLSHTFGQLISENICSLNISEDIDFIIPMPMHPTRLKQRGFNQALEIAKIVDKALNKHTKEKLNYKSVTRQTLTPPQASLPLKDRVKNIKGAFKVDGDLSGKRIAIVDDVMTSGASLNELAKTLKQAGATHVECWVIARTLPH
jgi:ComF family protein